MQPHLKKEEDVSFVFWMTSQLGEIVHTLLQNKLNDPEYDGSETEGFNL
jgi:hypothetical protein